MTTDQNDQSVPSPRGEDTALVVTPLSEVIVENPLDIRWEVPAQFHSLGVELPEEEREAHLAEVSEEIWSGGTEYQRTTVAAWYRDVADTAVEAGAVYSGFLIARTADDRATVATLLVQADHADTQDADAVASSLLEMLSADPANDVFDVTAPVGPVVVSAFGTVAEFDDGAGGKTELTLAQASAYIPVPRADTLLTVTISTPTLEDFPEYMGMLAMLVDSVVHDEPGAEPQAPGPDQESSSRITEMFG
ncbi:hypothetical protein [Kitasatospora phosalacinea]|uniref:hypothetical protein n=1 Tax=Kitasatospora phosalacinea TaxID=2065 RepID=UPI0005256A00|nr:hypothetical protein [Kitasatospora phosalacinea]